LDLPPWSSDSDSGIEDPTAALKNQVDRERRKRAHESSQATTGKVRKVVLGQKLASQSSGLSRSICNFIKFMMGMPASVSSYPAGPTSTEWSIWDNWTNIGLNELRFQRTKPELKKEESEHEHEK
jgi:hypothetical protein